MHKVFESLILDVDSYKMSHYKQYPKGTTRVWSYIEPRIDDVEVVNFGLQAFIKEYLSEPIRKEDVDFAEKLITTHGLPFNRMGWMHIVHKYNGHLPLLIKALPEGMPFKSHNCQLQVVNTDPECFWLTSFIETALLRAIWYPSTVATISRNVKKDIYKYLQITSDDPNGQIMFKLHDFGARGASSKETAMLGGMAHLVNFMGTDTISGLIGAMKYYGDIQTPETNMPGFSIPAAEHSTITSWGADNEFGAYENMVDQFSQPGKIYAVVSDSYDYFNAVDNLWGKELKNKIIQTGGTLVVRPDSGNPTYMINYALESLSKSFGFTINSKGFKVLNNVRLIQGDGIDPSIILDILKSVSKLGYSIDNIAFGMGGGLLQKVNRDTFKYAMKCCAIEIDGKIHPVFKNPVTDSGKISKSGILSTHWHKGEFVTDNNLANDIMIPIFKNGRLLKDYSFEEIRERAKL